MDDTLVAYISRCSWRSTPVARSVLRDDFKPSGVAFERRFPSEVAARAACDELIAATSHSWLPDDEVFLERSDCSTLSIDARMNGTSPVRSQ